MEGGDLRTLQLYDTLVCTTCTNHSNEHEESDDTVISSEMYKIDGEASEESINLKEVMIRLYTYEKCKFNENK